MSFAGFTKAAILSAAAIILLTSANAQMRMGLEPAPKETIVPDGGIAVPIIRFNRWVMVEAKINDKGPYRFVVDTGAAGLLIDRRKLEELKLPDDPMSGNAHIRVAGPGGQGVPASLHQVQSLKIGAAEFRELRALALDLPFPAQIAGVIGVGTLRECLIEFDYPRGEFRLSKGELPAADGVRVFDIKLQQSSSHPIIKIDACGKPIDFVVDTGSSGWFRFTKEITEQCGFAHGPVAGPPARMVDREVPTQTARLKGQLKIGQYVVDAPHGMLEESSNYYPLIGGGVLDRFAVALDLKNKRMSLTRNDKTPIKLAAPRSAGFALRPEKGGWTIKSIIAGSPAEKAGLKVGDVITEISGKPAEDVYLWPAWDEILKTSAVKLRYKSADADKDRETEVGIVELVP